MRLIDRYLLRELLLPLGACLAGFTIFWVAFDLLGELDHFQKAGVGLAGIARYYLIGLPELLNTTLPVALLLSLLYAITAHARHNELTAIRAAGIGIWRIILPYLAVGLAASGLLYWLSEHVAPDARERQDRMLEGNGPNVVDAAAWRGPVNFENQSAARSWSIGSFHPPSGEMRSVRLLLPVGAGARREIQIASARWTNGSWRFQGVTERLWRRDDDPAPAVRETLFTPIPQMPATNAVAVWPGGAFAVTNTFSNAVFVTNIITLIRTNLTYSETIAQIEWSAASYDPRIAELRRIQIREPLRQGAQRQFLADGATWTGSAWSFTNGNEYIFRNNRDREPMWLPNVERMAELDETPDIIRSELHVAGFNRAKALKRPQLSVQEILDYRRLHPVLKADMRAWLETQLHARMAAPWTCLVVVIIAVPFAAPSGRRNIFFGVAGSIGLAFVFFVLQRVGFALGQNGAVPPWLGAWLPNIVFALVGLILTARVR